MTLIVGAFPTGLRLLQKGIVGRQPFDHHRLEQSLAGFLRPGFFLALLRRMLTAPLLLENLGGMKMRVVERLFVFIRVVVVTLRLNKTQVMDEETINCPGDIGTLVDRAPRRLIPRTQFCDEVNIF